MAVCFFPRSESSTSPTAKRRRCEGGTSAGGSLIAEWLVLTHGSHINQNRWRLWTGNQLHRRDSRQRPKEIRILRIRLTRVSLTHQRRARELPARRVQRACSQQRDESKRTYGTQPPWSRAEHGRCEGEGDCLKTTAIAQRFLDGFEALYALRHGHVAGATIGGSEHERVRQVTTAFLQLGRHLRRAR